MKLTELINLYNMNKKTTATQFDKHSEIYYKKCLKRKKKSAQNFFILKHVIKDFKTSSFYYLKVLV